MRKTFRTMWILAVLLALYLGWTFYSRWSEKHEFIQHLEESQPSQKQSISNAYNSNLSILNFYAIPQTVHKGETAQLCYGVSNAVSVQIEPPVENIWPSYSRCVEIAPANDTKYKLTATDAEGNTVTKETAIKMIQD